MPVMLPVRRPADTHLERPAEPNGWSCLLCESTFVSMGSVSVSTTRMEDCPNCEEYASCPAAYVYRCPNENRECEEEAHHFGLGVHVEEHNG